MATSGQGAVGGNVPGGNVIPGGAKQLFLSYCREDNVNRFAKQLKQDLEERGFTVWIDVDIPAGTSWLDDIGSAMHNCKGVIAVITNKYVNSEYCTGELSFAKTIMKKIFPIRYEENVDITKPPHGPRVSLIIHQLQWTYFRPGVDDYSESLAALVRGLEANGIHPGDVESLDFDNQPSQQEPGPVLAQMPETDPEEADQPSQPEPGPALGHSQETDPEEAEMELELQKSKQQLASAKSLLGEEERIKVALQQKLINTEHEKAKLQVSLQEKEEMELKLEKSQEQLVSAKSQLEQEERTKIELQQKLSSIENEDAQLQVSLQEKEDKLKAMTEISRAQAIEVHKLQNEMQTLKNKMKEKDAEHQQLLLEQNKREEMELELDKYQHQLASAKSQLEEEERTLQKKEDELKTVKKVSRAKGDEVHELQNQLQTLKAATKRKHAEYQQLSLEQKKSENLGKLWMSISIMALLLAIGCGIWFVPPLSSTAPSKIKSVQGVVGCTETVLDIWGSKEQTVSWEGCGFNVTVPAGAVSKDVTDHVQLTVKAYLSSQFQLLVDSHLVSATYWVFANHVFQKDVFVHLYHWANITSEEEAFNYKLVVKKWSQETLSYRFKILNGVFRAHSQIATFSMRNFSEIQVQGEGEEKLIYEYHCYLIKTEPLQWKAIFRFTPQYPPALLEFKDYSGELINEYGGAFNFEGNSLPIGSEQRENDETAIKRKTVTVGIDDPREGQGKSWEIVPPTKIEILQDDIDEVNRNPHNATIPRCEISIKWTGEIGQLQHTKFSRRVALLGSIGPSCFFLKFSPSADASIKSQFLDEASEFVAVKRSLRGLTNWLWLGLELGMEFGFLKSICKSHGNKVSECKSAMLHSWLKTGTATKSKLVDALREMGEDFIADKVENSIDIPSQQKPGPVPDHLVESEPEESGTEETHQSEYMTIQILWFTLKMTPFFGSLIGENHWLQLLIFAIVVACCVSVVIIYLKRKK